MSIEVTYGIWKVSLGKGGRVYINCNDTEKLGHSDLASSHGALIYGLGYTEDLAVCILRFEEKLREQDGILAKLKQLKLSEESENQE